MSDNNQQALPFFARYLKEQFCEDLSVEEMNAVQGGLTLAAPADLGDEIRIHPRPFPRPNPYPTPRPFPRPNPYPIITSKITDLYAPETV